MANEKYIQCAECKSSRSLLINLVCEQCQRPLFQVHWWWFIPLVFLIFSIGFLLGQIKSTWVPFILVSSLFVIYMLIIFRRSTSTRRLILFLMVITLPVVFMAFYREQIIPQDASEQTLMYLRIATFGLVGAGVIYLLYHYFLEWWSVCQKSNIGWFKGFSVITFTLYLVSLLLDLANHSLGFLSPEIASIIENQIHFRTILLVLILIHTLSLAFINSAMNRIERPKDIFTNRSAVIYLWNPKPFPNPILNTFLVMAKSLTNAILTFYKNLGEILRAIANTMKVTIEFIIKLLINYVLEILKLIKVFLTTFFSTAIRFFRGYALPLILCYLIIFGIHLIVQNLYFYINAGEFSHQYSISTFIGVFIGIILLVWSITRYRFSSTLNSVSVSNMWVAFTLFVSTLVASWGLWLVANFLDASPYHEIGYFAAISTILLLLILIIIFSVRYRSREPS